jgi:serine/threonine protein kinase
MISAPSPCYSCGAINPIDTTFCKTCGKPLLLKHRYSILLSIRAGGFGEVYKAEDTLFGNRLVAIKEMDQSKLTPQELTQALADFKREAHILAGLGHPNLPKIHDYFEEAGNWYLVMDFIEGEALDDYLNSKGGKLLDTEVLRIGIEISTVLDYLHTQQPPVVFRDLSPENIMITSKGQIYLIDFGIARHFQPGMLYTNILGKKGYAAPEQYNRSEPATLLSDIYGLGATLHHLVSGYDPTANKPTLFDFAPLKTYVSTIPSQLDLLIMQMVEKDMHKRPQNMAFVKQQLEDIASQLMGSSPIAPTPVSSPPTPPATVQPGKCSNCGTQNLVGTAFCDNCGMSLLSTVISVPPVATNSPKPVPPQSQSTAARHSQMGWIIGYIISFPVLAGSWLLLWPLMQSPISPQSSFVPIPYDSFRTWAWWLVGGILAALLGVIVSYKEESPNPDMVEVLSNGAFVPLGISICLSWFSSFLINNFFHFPQGFLISIGVGAVLALIGTLIWAMHVFL